MSMEVFEYRWQTGKGRYHHQWRKSVVCVHWSIIDQYSQNSHKLRGDSSTHGKQENVHVDTLPLSMLEIITIYYIPHTQCNWHQLWHQFCSYSNILHCASMLHTHMYIQLYTQWHTYVRVYTKIAIRQASKLLKRLKLCNVPIRSDTKQCHNLQHPHILRNTMKLRWRLQVKNHCAREWRKNYWLLHGSYIPTFEPNKLLEEAQLHLALP